ncbi:hypothetical protein SAY86_003850 [Trapa natans]|uniref:Uncharacterized protein n=1 Tax=Trapa natans TaxID=22666 RepID=A0AAN7RPQ3_TRANT|nr:hypothetical protein SAY86_003850 [Trapa natans]
MEIERGAHIQKPQLKKRSTRLSLPGIDFDGMQKQSPPLLSPRRMLPAADQPTAQGGRTASALPLPMLDLSAAGSIWSLSLPSVSSLGSNLSGLGTKPSPAMHHPLCAQSLSCT